MKYKDFPYYFFFQYFIMQSSFTKKCLSKLDIAIYHTISQLYKLLSFLIVLHLTFSFKETSCQKLGAFCQLLYAMKAQKGKSDGNSQDDFSLQKGVTTHFDYRLLYLCNYLIILLRNNRVEVASSSKGCYSEIPTPTQ